MITKWINRYALRSEVMGSSIIREILKVIQQPDVISFAGGLPAPELFPVAEIEAACCRVLQTHGPEALQYSTTEGYPPLRRFIVQKMAEYGIVADEDNVLITHGSQQGLDLIGKLFLDRGNTVLLEAPTYPGAIQAWEAYEPRFVAVPIDEEGMQVERVEPILIQKRPNIIYVLPNFQNPAGTTLPLERRERLVDLASHYEVPIIEDDPYGELRYTGDHITPLLVLDVNRMVPEEKPKGGRYHRGDVIYLSTFSKTLAPGFRLGWMVAPVEVIRKLALAKQGSDLHTTTFNQMVVYEVVRNGFLKGHVRRLRKVYRQRRDTMLAAMATHFPAGVSWTTPAGGLFLWVTLPAGINVQDLLAEAIEKKVAFVPGSIFYTTGGGTNSLRLNFSNATPEQIEIGIERLGRVIRRALRAWKGDRSTIGVTIRHEQLPAAETTT